MHCSVTSSRIVPVEKLRRIGRALAHLFLDARERRRAEGRATRRRCARGCARPWRRRRRRASPPRRSRPACTGRFGHCLRFASTPVSAHVMTQRSGSRSCAASRSWASLLRAPCRRRPTSRLHDALHALGDLGQDLAAGRASRPPRGSSSALAEDLHRLDRRSRARCVAPFSVSRMWTTRRSSVERARTTRPSRSMRSMIPVTVLFCARMRSESSESERSPHALEHLEDRELRAGELDARGRPPS